MTRAAAAAAQNETFENVLFTNSGRTGGQNKITCPDCNGTIYAEPHRVSQNRGCRSCKSKFRLVLGQVGGGVLRYSLRRLSRGNLAPQQVVETQIQGGSDLSALEAQMAELQKQLASFTELDRATPAAPAAPVQRTLVAPVFDQSAIDITGDRHEAYDEVVCTLAACGRAFLVGPAGSGKTSLVQQIAEDLGKPFGLLACTEGLSEAHILGRMNVQGEYIVSAFVHAFETGGVFLLDEIDAMDENVALVINAAIDNGILAVPNRADNPIAKRHPEFMIVCAANTYGTGADAVYSGRNQLDGAFLDRFAGLQLTVDYDLGRERSIGESYNIMPLVEVIWQVRNATNDTKVRRAVSTRWMIHAGKLFATHPGRYTLGALLERCMASWTKQERAKVLGGVDLDALNGGQKASTVAPDAGLTISTPNVPTSTHSVAGEPF